MSFVLIELPRPFASAPPGLPAVLSDLNYLTPAPAKPVNYVAPPPGVAPRGGKPDRRQVSIRDARHLIEAPSLDREGFALRERGSALRDFDDPSLVRAAYYPEVERLLREETGAEHVVIFDHTLRSDSAATRQQSGAREPVRFVHNDYTHGSGRRRVTDHLQAEDAARRLQGRHAVVNVWRPIGRPVHQAPLAVCDARTIAADDLIATDLVYPDRVGEVYSVRFNPEHRWYYFSDMRPDEVLLIKTYDSLEDGTARFSAHTAFDDPTSPVDAAPRASIEVRALVFFPTEQRRPTWRADLAFAPSRPKPRSVHV